MTTLFYLEIIGNPRETSYQKPLTDWLKQHLPDVTPYDLDNLSEGLVLQYAGDLLGRTEKAALVVEIKSAVAPASKLLPFLEKFIVHPQAFAVLLGEEHPLISRMLHLLPPARVHRTSDWSAARPFLLSSLSS